MAVKKTKAVGDKQVMLAGKRERYNHMKHGMYEGGKVYNVTEPVSNALLDLRDGQDNPIFRVPSKKDLEATKPVAPVVEEGEEGEFDTGAAAAAAAAAEGQGEGTEPGQPL